jgi:NAD(P)-dependent dehydrogenase (short-subunit alcohol dehydrogenase family)
MVASMSTDPAPVALVTGGSRGLGRALTHTLLASGWTVITDGRDARSLDALQRGAASDRLFTVPGDVAEAAHRETLASRAADAGRLDLLVNNASVLGPSPQPPLQHYPIDELRRVYEVNTIAPLALLQLLLPLLEQSGGAVINVSSDAAVEPYPGWGGYGSAKAALDHLTAIAAAEHPGLRMYAVDPGDMATDMQQQAFPGEDISDRATPESVVPALLQLIAARPPSGRYRAAALLEQSS